MIAKCKDKHASIRPTIWEGEEGINYGSVGAGIWSKLKLTYNLPVAANLLRRG